MQAILQRILEQSAERGGDWRPSTSVLATAWPGLVGDRLADLTRPADVDWEEGRLIVETPSETWSRELSRREDELLDRIAQVLPWRLQVLEFRTGAFDQVADTPPGSDDDDSAEPRDRSRHSEPIETSDDLEESLDSLPEETAGSARRILEHVRDDQA